METNRVKEKRVAQELHDGVLGRMFGVRMNFDGLNRIQDGHIVNQRTSYLSELKISNRIFRKMI
jgi:signal transduction histidine kinase